LSSRALARRNIRCVPGARVAGLRSKGWGSEARACAQKRGCKRSQLIQLTATHTRTHMHAHTHPHTSHRHADRQSQPVPARWPLNCTAESD
jgi:hypothetical protein